MLDRSLVLPHAIESLATTTPNAPAIVDVAGRTVTYAGLRDAALQWAGGFQQLGVGPGHNVLTMLPNSLEAYFGWLGVAWLGAIEVPTNTMYRGAMLAYLLNDSEAEIAVVASRFIDRLAEVASEVKRLRVVVVPDADGDLPALPFEVIRGEEFLAGEPAQLVGPDYHDVSCMIYTSGTTGPSKGVLVPWAELYEFVRILPADTLDAGRAMYTTYPAFHVSGKVMLYMTVDRSGHLILRETFSPSEFWNDIKRHDCQAAGLLGPMAALLMLAPPSQDDASTPLENVFMGPLIPSVGDFAKRFDVKVGTGYGMTEIGVPLASNGFDLVDGHSCGRRRVGPPGYEVRIVDEYDEPVPPDTVGELVVRAADPWVLNAGYWRLPEATARAWRNGWFHTGDGFREDADGNFYFVDRLKDSIRRRGENISSFEVEAGVIAHPAVLECAAIGVPSEFGEDDVKVVVVRHPGEELTPVDLIEFLVTRMPRFMIPRYVEFADALPKTDATFRVQKIHLRASAFNDRVWDREAAGMVLPRD